MDSPVRRKGVIVRTDFTDDINWAQFITTVTENVQSVLSDIQTSPTEAEDQNMEEDGDESSGEESGEDDAEMTPAADVGKAGASVSQLGIDAIFALVNEPTFLNASNIRLLRAFVDVDVVPCPGRAESVKPIKGRNPLVDLDGLQEVYEGRVVWVYDAETVKTGSVRLISGRQKTYGVATYVLCPYRHLLRPCPDDPCQQRRQLACTGFIHSRTPTQSGLGGHVDRLWWGGSVDICRAPA